MTVRGGRAQQTHGQWRATMRTSERRRFSPVLRGVTRITGPFSVRGLLAHVFFSPATFLVRVGCAHCARFLYLDVPRAARMRAGGRPSWRRLGPRRDEPQLSFRLSREMASLVSGIAGVEVLVKPCVGHARCLEGGRGVGRGRDGREGTSAGVPEDTRTRSNATHNEHGLSTEALKEWTLAPCLAQGELLGNGVQGE